LGAMEARRSERHGELLIVPGPNAAETLPQRVRALCQWALEQPGWDYLFKCEDDTYVAAARLAAYRPAGRHYLGAEWRPGGGHSSGGGGYLLSRKAVALIAERLVHARGYEDVLVGALLREAGIPLSLEPRFVPLGSADLRPMAENDLITVHGASDAVLQA